MKKQILNLGITLSKNDQKKINGGGAPDCSTYSGPNCYSYEQSQCGSCKEYHALPEEHKLCAIADYSCFYL